MSWASWPPWQPANFNDDNPLLPQTSLQLATKENLRETAEQRNSILQTVMVLDTLMAGSAFAMIVVSS